MGEHKGIFIAIDGIDGSGKTTLSSLLCALLADYDPEPTKEPTADNEWGRRLRLSATEGRLPRETEIDFFHRDRLHHIEHFIRPRLEQGRVVICDRYVDSTLAFQARDSAEADRMYEQFAPDLLLPDVTFILRCPVSVGLQRIHDNRPEKSTFEEVGTLEHAHMIYESRVAKDGKYVGIDATGSIQSTLAQALIALVERFPHLKATLRAHFIAQNPDSQPPF
jgi:dTMP kinase